MSDAWQPEGMVRVRLVKASGLKAWVHHYPDASGLIELQESAFYASRGEPNKGDPKVVLTFRKVEGNSDEYLEDPSLTKKAR